MDEKKILTDSTNELANKEAEESSAKKQLSNKQFFIILSVMVSLLIVTLIVIIILLLGKVNSDGTNEDSSNEMNNASHIHKYDDWRILYNATCSAEGGRERKCHCGQVEFESIPKSDVHSAVDGGIIEPTCTEVGYASSIKCYLCGELIRCDGEIASLGHSLPGWDIIYPSDVSEGAYYRECSRCGYSESESISKVDASMFDYVESSYDGEKCYIITGYNGDKSVLYLPTEINGVKVRGIDFPYAQFTVRKVYLHKDITSIGAKGFAWFSEIDEIIVNEDNQNFISVDGVLYSKNMEKLYSYPNQKSDKQFTIPDGVKTIDNYAFYGCYNLVGVNAPDTVTAIGAYAFAYCNTLTSVNIPSGVTGIGKSAFISCTSLTAITIPKGVKSIGEQTFSMCESLTSVTIPDGVTSIGESAFSGCDLLMEINIPNSLTSIENYALSYCLSLESINIPASVKSIGITTFIGCASLKSINVDINNPTYKSIDGVLYTKNGNRLMQYPGLKDDTLFIVPDGVTEIDDYAFYGCRLTEVVLPEGLLSIGLSAFNNCVSLKEISIPDSVTSIGEYAFSGCSSLTSIVIPDKITRLENNVFSFCTSLTEVVIGSGVTEIGANAFYDCTSLRKVVIPSGVTVIENDAFENCYSLSNIYYSVFYIGSTEQWKIVNISSGNQYLTRALIKYNYIPE